ncbi:MAG TPA: HAMP domain-containing sensor histidine kinase [Gemmatimonadales bacterium]|nr:HAMP domain-containing sensor histidine kinase [Gemmatimonadales bacterium]
MTTAAVPGLQALASSPVFEELLIRADRSTVVASLARGMAHDLRGPLQTLTLLVDPHADLLGGSEAARLRTAVSDAVQHLADTIARFGQVYAPSEPDAAPIIVGDLLAYVADLQRYQRGLPVLEVELRLEAGLPPVRGVESQLRHLLLSLVLNAKEAMIEREEAHIAVTAEGRDSMVHIAVEDNGPGLDSRARGAAFEPFFSTRPGHLGIGLTVARWLAERHGGTLSLETVEAGGTRAVLSLPAWRRAAEFGLTPRGA